MTFTYDIETWFKVNAHHLLTCSLSITMSKIMTRGEKVWSKTRFQRYLLWPSSLTLKLGSRSLHTLYLNALWKCEKYKNVHYFRSAWYKERTAILPYVWRLITMVTILYQTTLKSEVSLCKSVEFLLSMKLKFRSIMK